MTLSINQRASINKLKERYGSKNVSTPLPLLDHPDSAMVRVEKEGKYANSDLTEYVGESQPYSVTYRIDLDGFILVNY